MNTLEQHAIQKHVLNLGIELLLNRNVVEYDGTHVAVECTYTGRRTMLAAEAIVTVTSRLPHEELALALAQMPDRLAAAHIASVTSIGDCWAPSTLATAVYAGHRHAREFNGRRTIGRRFGANWSTCNVSAHQESRPRSNGAAQVRSAD